MDQSKITEQHYWPKFTLEVSTTKKELQNVPDSNMVNKVNRFKPWIIAPNFAQFIFWLDMQLVCSSM